MLLKQTYKTFDISKNGNVYEKINEYLSNSIV